MDRASSSASPPPVSGCDSLRQAVRQDGEGDGEGERRWDVEEIQDEGEAERVLPEGVRKSLKEEATSLYHQLIHPPKNPYCDTR